MEQQIKNLIKHNLQKWILQENIQQVQLYIQNITQQFQILVISQDYIPEGMTFKSELNPDWYTGTDGMLYTTALEDVELQKGETREIKLVLTKQMTEENTGIVNNIAEIYEDYNIYGISDKNSTPGNKVQNENDMSSADTMLTVKTGEVFIHISVIITSILLGSIVIFIAYNKLILNKKKGGA